MTESCITVAALSLVAIICAGAHAQQSPQDRTCFQIGGGYSPEVDIGSDVAVVYGVDPSFADRAAKWRACGYAVSMMTGVAWGGYGAYYGSGDSFKKDEVQTRKSGKLIMHGDDVGYNVPTDGYIEFLKHYVEPAVDAGVQGIYMEEPEFWADAGWSEGFKRAWQAFYDEPWQPPDSSVDAQYRASKLKYELYFKTLREVFAHVDRRAAEKGIKVECHVPTHSLINYAQWRIVSPESHLIDIPELDGYIAQVWTGTARCANMYRGVGKERTFETAYLEYGQAFGMVRPTGKKVWFLADPVEDNPNYSWNDYKRNYECTVIASLMWPEVHRYEVMPWPDRIFNGKYADADMSAKSGDRVGIPPAYATQILAVINALNDMDQSEVVYDTGSRGVGIVVSDTLMFQRAAPQPSDFGLGHFYGLALPLVKHGIPVEIVQLENTPHPDCLRSYQVLLLSYEGQKPLKPEYHEALNQWVRGGGRLIFIEDGTDPYHAVREWWNDQGRKPAKAYEDLFARLGVTEAARVQPERVGAGFVRIVNENPSVLQHQKDGPEKVLNLVCDMFKRANREIKTQNYLCIRRGPYVVASALDESVSDEPLHLKGPFVDVFDPALPVVAERVLAPNQRTLLYNLAWPRRNGVQAKVLACAASVRQEAMQEGAFVFVCRGPKGTHARARVLLPHAPTAVRCEPSMPIQHEWDPASSTVLLSFDNIADDMRLRLELQ